jgi:WD40 repeat protein
LTIFARSEAGGVVTFEMAVQVGRYDSFVSAAAVLPDGRMVAAGDPDGRLLLWDQASGAGPVEIGRHGSEVLVLRVLSDGQRLLTAHEGQGITRWSLHG